MNTQGNVTSIHGDLEKLAKRINTNAAKEKDVRLEMAIDLAAAKAICKEKGTTFKSWVEDKLSLSYDEARKLARIGESDDPEAALAARRKQTSGTTQRNKAGRRRPAPDDTGPHEQYIDLLEEVCEDCTTDEERWQRSCGFQMGELLALRAYWRQQFGDWEKFDVPSSLVTLVKQAAEEISKLASDLKR